MAGVHEQIDQRRRGFIAAATIGSFAYQVGGIERLLTPAAARAAGAAMGVLTPAETLALEALGECLVPGARAAGIAHYVDANLARAPSDVLLMLRYLGVLPPYTDFYRRGLAGLDAASSAATGKVFAALDETAATDLVAAMAKADPKGWSGPPAPLFYFALRGDAVDIVYGTRAGFEALSVPYLAHIEPKADF